MKFQQKSIQKIYYKISQPNGIWKKQKNQIKLFANKTQPSLIVYLLINQLTQSHCIYLLISAIKQYEQPFIDFIDCLKPLIKIIIIILVSKLNQINQHLQGHYQLSINKNMKAYAVIQNQLQEVQKDIQFKDSIVQKAIIQPSSRHHSVHMFMPHHVIIHNPEVASHIVIKNNGSESESENKQKFVVLKDKGLQKVQQKAQQKSKQNIKFSSTPLFMTPNKNQRKSSPNRPKIFDSPDKFKSPIERIRQPIIQEVIQIPESSYCFSSQDQAKIYQSGQNHKNGIYDLFGSILKINASKGKNNKSAQVNKIEKMMILSNEGQKEKIKQRQIKDMNNSFSHSRSPNKKKIFGSPNPWKKSQRRTNHIQIIDESISRNLPDQQIHNHHENVSQGGSRRHHTIFVASPNVQSFQHSRILYQSARQLSSVQEVSELKCSKMKQKYQSGKTTIKKLKGNTKPVCYKTIKIKQFNLPGIAPASL